MNMILSQQDFMLLKLFHLKIIKNENSAFLLLLLLMAGDIESNPGNIFLNNDFQPSDKFQNFS